ncbi:MAG: relaxase/mobilization nuclease domain-containing protein [Streptosporangiaceae bacterium]
MIGRILARGRQLGRLLYYLYGPGKACEHVNPHLVSGWRHPAALEPPLRPDGHRDFRQLTGLMLQPVALLGDRAPAAPVWHCAVRAAPGDPDLGDGAWMRIAAEIMDRTGLSRYGEEDEGVRWVAMHHGDNHIHIVATLARQDGRRASLDNERWRVGAALRDIEAEYGLVAVARADRTAARRPSRAETEKAARNGQAEPPRVTLRRHVSAAAAGARSEPEFFAALARRGVQVRLRHSDRNPGEVTGYAVTLPGARTAAGEPVWFGGGKLAPDLTLPKLRRRWPEPSRAQQQARGPGGPQARPRLHGRQMGDGTGQAVLRREVAAVASAARSEPEFFAGLEAAGLLIRLRYDDARPGEAAGYAVSLPGMVHHQDGQQVWYGGQRLDGRLGLGTLRRRWRAGRTGTPPFAADFTGTETGAIFSHATEIANEAARRLRAGPRPDEAADIAWAAADVLYAAADATGSSELRTAADVFSRAARAPWGRIPAPSPVGAGLRTAAYLLARSVPAGSRRVIARRALTTALAGLVASVGDLRQAQHRQLQASAARHAAVGLNAAAVTTSTSTVPVGLATVDTPGLPVTARAAGTRPDRRVPSPSSPPRPRRIP